MDKAVATQSPDGCVVHRTSISPERIQAVKFGDKNSEWVCLVCNRFLSDQKTISEHVRLENHVLKVKDEEIHCYLKKLLPPSDQHTLYMTEYLEPIYSGKSASLNGNIKTREDIASELEAYVQEEFPDVSAGLHGSSVSKFALIDSDVNIYLLVPETGSRHHNRIPVVMRHVADILRKQKKIYSLVVEDYYAYNRIPRIIFKHKPSKLSGEIRVNVGNPLSLAYILGLYNSIDPRVHQLGVLFRYWAKVCGADCQEIGHYPAHMFIVMAIHFLQQRKPPVVPVLHEMFPELLQNDHSVSSDCSFVTEEVVREITSKLVSWKSANSEPLGQLWLGLFRYYAMDFAVEKYAVSILQSEPLSRESQWGTYRLAVEDPMIQRSNLARAGSNDKVFAYLWSSVKCSAVHFYKLSKKPGASVPEVESKESILLEDASILNVRSESSAGESVSRDGHVEDPLASCENHTQDLEELKDLQLEDQCVPAMTSNNTEEQLSLVQDSLKNFCIQDSHSVASVSDTPAQIPGSSGDVDAGVTCSKQPKKNSKKKRGGNDNTTDDFTANCLVYMKYPVMCLGCKKLHHKLSTCPSERLPSFKLPKTPLSSESLKSIKKVFRKYMRDTDFTEEEKSIRHHICEQILHHVRQVYPDANLLLFGSSANGFGSYTSDLDICLALPQLAEMEQMDKAIQGEIIEAVAVKLKQNRKDYQEITTITSARVPIVKFSLPRYGLDCDISLDNRLALRNTKLIAAYAIFDQRVRLLGYAVKFFAKTCDMGDASTGSLSSYAYILLVIHYLQQTQPPVIPCLQQVPTEHPDEPLINNWNCYFYAGNSIELIWPHYKKNQESIGCLWLGFLQYYLTFDWLTEVVTIRQLTKLSKFDKWWLSKPMCIEDPFNLEHNLASAVTTKMRLYILERFQKALWIHSKNTIWKDIDHLFNVNELVGDERAPKFMICNYCQFRGHKAANCPNKNTGKRYEKNGSKASAQHDTRSKVPLPAGTPGTSMSQPHGPLPHGLLPHGQLPHGQLPHGQLPAGTPGTSMLHPHGPLPHGQLPHGPLPAGTPGTSMLQAHGQLLHGPLSPGTPGTSMPQPHGPLPHGQLPHGPLPAGTPGTSVPLPHGPLPAGTPGTSMPQPHSPLPHGPLPAGTPGTSMPLPHGPLPHGPLPAGTPGTSMPQPHGPLPAGTPGTSMPQSHGSPTYQNHPHTLPSSNSSSQASLIGAAVQSLQYQNTPLPQYIHGGSQVPTSKNPLLSAPHGHSSIPYSQSFPLNNHSRAYLPRSGTHSQNPLPQHRVLNPQVQYGGTPYGSYQQPGYQAAGYTPHAISQHPGYQAVSHAMSQPGYQASGHVSHPMSRQPGYQAVGYSPHATSQQPGYQAARPQEPGYQAAGQQQQYVNQQAQAPERKRRSRRRK